MQITTPLKILGLMLSCLAAYGQVFAQAQVVDAASDRAANSSQQNTQAQASTTSQNDIMVDMYLQLEALQSEIQNLRGLVEEQSYQIRRMQTEQRDRYLDTDSRLSELFSYHAGQQPAGIQTSPGGNTGQVAPFAGNSNQRELLAPGAIGVTTAAAGTLNEQDLYRQALSQLLEQEAFQDSVNLFQQYIDIYPQGSYFTNALYWQGAGLHLLGNYPQSIAVLQRLLNEYPQDPKAPTAMLRLGTVYNEMGDKARAVDYWRRISETYPSSTSEIELARDYLNDAGI
jgi:tol-pal system protein YbgF